MKKSSPRKNRSRRSQLAGLALSAVLALFSVQGSSAQTLHVGPGKDIANLESVRNLYPAGDGVEIILHKSDLSLLGAFQPVFYDASKPLSFRSADAQEKTIAYAGIRNDTSQFLNILNNAGTVQLNEHLTLTGFYSKSGGGVASIGEEAVLETTGVRFETNGSNGFGGTVYSRGGIFRSRNSLFQENSAESGGAVYSAGGNTLLDDSEFIANDAQRGGAVYQFKGTLNAVNTTFRSNTALFGGAAVTEETTALFRNVMLVGNRAQTRGGGVYVAGNSTIHVVTDDGNTSLWQGNRDANGFNSIAFNLDGNGTSQKLSVYGGGTLEMNDPLRSVKTSGGNSLLNISKDGEGKWILGGRSQFIGTGLTTVFEVGGGTLELARDASMAMEQGLFTAGGNAVLVSQGLNRIEIAVPRNGETAGSVFKAGSTLEFKMAGLSETDDNKTPMLEIQGGLKLPSDGKFTVDVSSVNAYRGDGDYILVAAQDAGFNAGNTAFFIKGGDHTLASANNRTGTRTFGFLDRNGDKVNDAVILTLDGVDKNRTMYWEGSKNQVWNETTQNWKNNDTDKKVNQFLNGDDVVFGESVVNKNITVGEDVTVGTMSIAGQYVFTGKDIYGEQLIFSGNGSVTFGSRNFTLQSVADASTQGGLIAKDGERLEITAAGNRSAVLGKSGSVFTVGQADSTGTVHFVNNVSSTGSGGAADGNTVQLLGGTNIFSENRAKDYGGAVKAAAFQIQGGEARFENNLAGKLGGAIYVTGNAVLNAEDGDILFRNNRQGAAQTPNAVYLENTGGAKTLTLSASAGHSITFYDPIESNAQRNNLKVNIRGEGTTRFIEGQSDIHATTVVNGGATVQLSYGAVYGADSDNPLFTVKSGGTVLAEGQKNQINAESIVLENNSTVQIDLNGADNTGKTASLQLNGDTQLPTGGTFNINAAGVSQNGVFQLLRATDETDFSEKTVTKFNGTVVTNVTLNDRKGTQEFYFQPGAVYLKQTGADANRSLTWVGSTGVWNEETGNWQVSEKDSKYFINGDTVLFNQNGQTKDISVAASGVTVGGLKVTGGDYTFNGGTVSQLNDGVVRTLDKSGSGTLTLNQKNVFSQVRVYSGILAGGNAVQPVVVGDIIVNNTGAVSPGGSGAGTFRTDGSIEFKAGSLLYIDLGKTEAKSDLLYASDVINFSSDTVGTVTIVVSGNNVAAGEHTSDSAVVRSEKALQINGQTLNSGETQAADDKVVIQRGSAKIVIESDSSLDLQSANIFGGGKQLSIDATGTGSSPVPPSNLFTWNQKIVLNSINGAHAGTFANSLMAGYARTSESGQSRYLEQLLPAIHTAMPMVTQRAASQFRQVAFERLRFLNETAPYRYRGLFQPTDEILQGKETKTTTRGQRFCANAAPVLWGQNYGDFMHQRTLTVQGFQSDSYGIALGTDRWLDQNTVIGLGFGGAFARVKTADKSQWGNADTFLFSLYGSHTDTNAVKYMGTIGYSYSDYEIYRTPGGNTVSGKHGGNQFFMAADISKKFRGTWTDITPFLGLDLIYLDEDGSDEKPASGNTVSHINGSVAESYLQTLGARIGRTRTNYFGWTVNPSAWLGWIHDYGDGFIYKTALYNGGAVYRIKGASMNSDRFGMGLNYNANVNNQFSFFSGYNAEYGTRFSVHTIQAGFTFEF